MRPSVATNANASATPPNWASTPHSEITARRTIEVGGLLTISQASTAPSTAPMSAVLPESSTLLPQRVSAVSENSAWMSSEREPAVGVERADDHRDRRDEQEDHEVERGTAAAAATASAESRRATHGQPIGLGPVVRQVLGGLLGLVGGRESPGRR